MTDRRVTPDPARVTTDTPGQIAWPHVDLLAHPAGPRDRQLLLGEAVTILGSNQQHSYIRSEKDGYIGYVTGLSITTPQPPSHQVIAAATHSYGDASIRSADLATLSFGAKITASGDSQDFVETSHGHIPKQALAELPTPARDPITTARLFLNTPYLWGGNTRSGIDCSGLIQAALLAANMPCPGDSDQQQQLGQTITNGQYQSGDLLFWNGHVALVTSPTKMIHANAHHMQVVEEPITQAIIRIARTTGPVTAHKRL